MNITEELNSIFDFDNDSEKLEFEERVLNSDVMAFISELMRKNNIKTKSELAKKLGVSKVYITKLFSGDKKFNVTLLAKLQRLFDMRFKLVDKNSENKATYLVLKIGGHKEYPSNMPTLRTNNTHESISNVKLKYLAN